MAQSKSDFGPEDGADLSVVIYVRCDGQEAISASGVTGVWGQIEQLGSRGESLVIQCWDNLGCLMRSRASFS